MSLKDHIIETCGKAGYDTFVNFNAREFQEDRCIVCREPLEEFEYKGVHKKCIEEFKSNKLYYKRIADKIYRRR